MRALNELAQVKKSKLDDFQREINSFRSGSLDDDTIDKWKKLPDDERKIKVTVFLCMLRVPEKELERIARTLNPPWKPFITGLKILFFLLFLFPLYKTATYFMADRVYPKVFEYDVRFTDGSVKTHVLFENYSMIRQESDSVTVLLEANIFDWFLGKSKKADYDSTLWTSNKDLFDELKFFYANFQNNASRSKEIKAVSLPIEKIYKATTEVAGIRKIQMDLRVPENLANNHSPFFSYPNDGTIYFFLSATEEKNYWNIKIDFRNEVLRAEEIKFSPDFYPDKQRKVIWDLGHSQFPALKKLTEDSTESISEKYYIIDLSSAIAKKI